MLIAQEIYRTAIYCRLSQDDGVEGDSSSIQTQKMMLEKHCRENNYEIVDFYIDDGYSGTNFNRPDFQRMLKDIEDKKINLVITKDQSRLGRDYIMTGYYMEIYFPNLNVRYIALSDGVDTINGSNDVLPFKNILNDMYSKDLSKKVRASLRQRAMQGMYLGADAPYGYIRDPSDTHKLLINFETAGTVKKIFNLMLLGYGTVYIARVLTKEQILIPSAYKLKNGNTRFQHHIDIGEECRWTDGMVKRIINEQIYTGDMVNGKTQIANYKTKKSITNSREKHIIVPNTHEAIISKEDFARAQKLKSERHYRRKKYDMPNIFRGIVKCSVCGKSMVLTTQFRRGKFVAYYRCNTFTSYKYKDKHWITIKYTDIKEIVTERLRELFIKFKDDETIINLIRDRLKKNNKFTIDYDKEISKITTRQNTLSNITKKVYDDYFAGLINNDMYLDLIKKYQNEQVNLKEKHNLLLVERDKKDDNLEDVVNSFLDLKDLKQELVFSLIDKIVIENIGAYKQPKQRKINITYRFAQLDKK